jgi:hypothetical protein
MPTVYSTSLARDEIVAAQMCLDTTSISLEEPHVIDIISDLDSSSINTGNCVKITPSDFEKMFYGKNVSSSAAAVPFDQSFSLIGTGQTAVNYYQLDASANNDINAPDDTQYSIMNGNGEPTNQTVSLVKPVTDFWVKDTGHSVDCWSTCSYMSIQKEIEATHNLQNLDCNICCSLCYGELLGLLDSKYPLDNGTKRTRVVSGDKVGIRILYKNAFEGTKNVEVRIHYQIINRTTRIRVIDGYISGATVFRDLNNDGVLNVNEPRGVTDENGVAIIEGDTGIGSLIAFGGINIDTGEPFTAIMKSPEGATSITPLTSIVNDIMENGYDMGMALSMVQAAFELNTSDDILTLDPIATKNVAVSKAGIQVATLLQGVGGGKAGTRVGEALAIKIVENSSSPSPVSSLSLSNATNIVEIIDRATAADPIAMTGVNSEAVAVSSEFKNKLIGTATTISDIQDIESKEAEIMAYDSKIETATMLKIKLSKISTRPQGGIVELYNNITVDGELNIPKNVNLILKNNVVLTVNANK